jgi:hypothetical protein
MTGRKAVVPAAQVGVDLAVRALPNRADRERYATEFLAELYGMSPAAQLRHTAGVLSHVLALRAALGTSPRDLEKTAMRSRTSRGQRFRCRYMHWHRWHELRTDDGERYRACSACGKERAWDTQQVGGWVS